MAFLSVKYGITHIGIQQQGRRVPLSPCLRGRVVAVRVGKKDVMYILCSMVMMVMVMMVVMVMRRGSLFHMAVALLAALVFRFKLYGHVADTVLL